MDNQTRISRFVLLAPFRSKAFWLPVLVGAGLMMMSSGFLLAIGAASFAVALGSVAWKLTIGRERLIRKVEHRLRQVPQLEQRAETKSTRSRNLKR